jgi:hypothetical protein
MKEGHEKLEFDDRTDKRNMVEVAEPTEAGWSVIRLRKADIPEWIKKDKEQINYRKSIPPDILEVLSTSR